MDGEFELFASVCNHLFETLRTTYIQNLASRTSLFILLSIFYIQSFLSKITIHMEYPNNWCYNQT